MFASRRPIFRCLNNPTRTLSRNLFSKAQPIKRTPATPPELDINNVSVHRLEAARRAYYVRRRNWLALGAAVSMAIPILLIQFFDLPPATPPQDAEENTKQPSTQNDKSLLNLITPRPTQTDSPRDATQQFQGKKVVIAAGDKIIAAPASTPNPTATSPDAIELIETGTSYIPYFPKTITLPTTSTADPSSSAEYTLLGLGIRRVSFLSIQVYVVGLYVKTSSLSTLQNALINTINPTASTLIAGEKDALRAALLDAEKSNQIWESILSRHGAEGVEMALRIVPTRGTDFNHLRDGLMRGITSRTDEVNRKQAELLRQAAAEARTVALPKPVAESEFADEGFGAAMRDFKALFQGRGKAGKGSVIVLRRDGEGAVEMLYQASKKAKEGLGELERLGVVRDERVGRLLWLLYLGGKNVSSEEARRSIVDGCVAIVERPVGTVEGMVQ